MSFQINRLLRVLLFLVSLIIYSVWTEKNNLGDVPGRGLFAAFVLFPSLLWMLKKEKKPILDPIETKRVIEPDNHIYNSEINQNLHPEDYYFSIALKEIKANRVPEGLWAIALAYGDGNLEKSKAYYLRERVKRLKQSHAEKIDKDLINKREQQLQLVKQRHKEQQDADRLKEEAKIKNKLLMKEKEYNIQAEKHDKYKGKLIKTSDKEEIASIHIARLRELDCIIVGEISPFVVISKQGKKFTIEKLDDLRIVVEDCNTSQLCELLLSYHGYDLEWNGFKWLVSNAKGHRESFRRTDEVMDFCSTI